MKKRKAWLIIAAIMLLACGLLSQSPTQIPNNSSTGPKDSLTPQFEIQPTEKVMSSNNDPTPTPEHSFTIVRLQPLQGSLSTLLAQEVQKAHQIGQQPFVEFDASW